MLDEFTARARRAAHAKHCCPVNMTIYNAILRLKCRRRRYRSPVTGAACYTACTAAGQTRKGYQVEVLDYLDGEEAGIKSVTIQINGENAFGYLKSERGVHRLVRISPFNANGKRQTSFVSCDVMPDIEEDLDVEINPDDLRIDTYRSSGAGGQHINKTSSASPYHPYPDRHCCPVSE